jgi:DNA-binding CsgD family transcriptional regulator
MDSSRRGNMTVIAEAGLRRELGSAARPLLERDGELAALRAAVESARDGDGQLVVVEGAAGIGKTRLLGEVRSLATEFEVLSARAGELESDFAFGIVRQLFEGVLASAPPDVRAELLSGAAALAAPLFAVVPGEPGEAGAETSFAMLHGLYWLAANFALRQPTLIAVDDLHWADEPSVRWLGYLAKRLEGLPLLVVAATRPPERARAPVLVTEILADPLATVIRPVALGQASAVTLAQVLFGLEPDDVFAAALRDASDGNPLYLVAILDAVARQQIAPTAEQASRLLELGGEALSRGIALRLSRLPGEAVALVRAAAILGDQTELARAAALAGLDASAALDAASALVHSDLLEQENPLVFRHPVVRSAVLDDISAGERMRLHRCAAEVLLISGVVPERAATYLTLTIPDHDPFVVATLRRAAQRSLSRGAPEAAVAYLRRALDEPPEPQERRDVLGELGIAESAVFEADSGAAHLRQALDELDDITKRPDLVLAYVNALELLANRAPEQIELLTQLGEGSQHDRVFSERIDAQLMRAALYDGELYRIAREHWDAISARDARESIQAGALLATGAFEEARRGISRERAVELARRAAASGIGRTPERIYLGNGLYALMLAGEVEEAESGLRAGIEDARRAGDRFSGAIYHMWRGLLRMERGKLLAAEEDLGVPEVISFEALATALVYRAAFLAEVLVPRGEYAGAEALLARVDIEEVQAGHRILFLCGRGRLYLETSRPEQALADFRAVGELAGPLGIENPAFCPWRSQAALALHRLGRVDRARELGREELDLSRRWGPPRTIGISLRALGLVEGGLTGEQLLRDAVEVLAGSPARLEHARALIDLGAALRRANSRSEARKHLRDGVDLAHQCGATALVARANEELAATGAHPRKVMLSGLESLTASERRVAQMAAEEVSNKEIAQALFVTVKTVEVHLSRVYRKLEIESRRQLAGALSAPAVEPATR